MQMSELAEQIDRIASSLQRTGLRTHAYFVVRAAEELNLQLEEVLRAQMIPLSNKRSTELFGDRGILTTFSSKIKIAYALGLLDEEASKRLEAIRKVRNAFAHTRSSISLDNDEIRSFLAHLSVEGCSEAGALERYVWHAQQVELSLDRVRHLPQATQAASEN